MKITKSIKIISPVLVGVTLGLIINIKITIPDIQFVSNAIINCTATFSGFVLTAVSILIGLNATPIMKEIKKNNNTSELISYMIEPLIIGILLILFCIFIGEKSDIPSGKSYTLASVEIKVGIALMVSYIGSLILTCFYVFNILYVSAKDETVRIDNKPSTPPGEIRIKNDE